MLQLSINIIVLPRIIIQVCHPNGNAQDAVTGLPAEITYSELEAGNFFAVFSVYYYGICTE